MFNRVQRPLDWEMSLSYYISDFIGSVSENTGFTLTARVIGPHAQNKHQVAEAPRFSRTQDGGCWFYHHPLRTKNMDIVFGPSVFSHFSPPPTWDRCVQSPSAYPTWEIKRASGNPEVREGDVWFQVVPGTDFLYC